ncbi:BON domain-containing protein [Paraburkholderia phymatum]|nr:BON domain-containing protein [Paraburkholderia phymatum]
MTTATFNISPLDWHLANCVVERIRHDPSLCDESICVDVRDSRAVLRGTVSSYAARIAACEAAEETQGIASVTADLTVEVPQHLRRSDAEIRDSALDALKWRACLPSGAVTVSVCDGRVTLSGQVDWSYQRKLAEKVLVSLPGITSVSNKLRVSDRQIQLEVSARIRAALRVAAEKRADAIKVEVRDGVVTLRGQLPVGREHALARSAALCHSDVREVQDALLTS